MNNQDIKDIEKICDKVIDEIKGDGMEGIDKIIFELFTNNWVGETVTKDLDNMKKQLHKNLINQVDGYWSGSTAYHIMTKGGFLIDSKSGTKKELTELGKVFIKEYENK